MPKKPSPKTVKEVCTVCGLDWAKHGENPTLEKCIALLLAEVASLTQARYGHGVSASSASNLPRN